MVENKKLQLKTVSSLKGKKFIIPYQQRGYRWTEDNVKQLLDDLLKFIESNEKSSMYCLQPLAIVTLAAGDKEEYKVIDGQQRLTTMFLLYKYLHSSDTQSNLYEFSYERDSKNERKDFLENVAADVEKFPNKSSINEFYISQAYLAIKNWFSEKSVTTTEKFIELLDADENKKSVQFLWYDVDEDKEHEIFRNINSGKIQLTNAELIKALLLSKTNSFTDLERARIAAQFEQTERQLSENRFWYMFRSSDVDTLKGQSRIDFLFNLAMKVKDSDYQTEPRSAFFKISKYFKNEIERMWKEVRNTHQRLRDFFDDPYTFHYIGFLTFCEKNPIKDIFGKYEGKSKIIEWLKKEIKDKFDCPLKDFNYDSSKEELRKLFVLHNIESILQNYKELRERRNLKFSYEYFPFELLHSQKWNIEHIASQTPNNLESESDKKDWLSSVKEDFPKEYENTCKKLYISTTGEKPIEDSIIVEKKFDNFCKELQEEIPSMKNSLSDKEKDSLGNLVLLDEHTNKSFHNSLFPKKRRIVIIASGLRKKSDDKEKVESVYVPYCTKLAFLKAYNKTSSVKLNEWTKDDLKKYFDDITEKLSEFFPKK